MSDIKKIIVAVTGASGAIYARKTLEALRGVPYLEQIAVIASRNGKAVAEYEHEKLPDADDKTVWFDNDDMFAPPPVRPAMTPWS